MAQCRHRPPPRRDRVERKSMRIPPRTGVAAAVVTALATAVVGGSAGPASAAAHVRHVGTRPSWATSARDVGRANGRDRVNLRVWLALRNARAARALAAAVAD